MPDAKNGSTNEKVTKLVEQLGSPDQKSAYQARLALWEKASRGSVGERADVAKALAAELGAQREIKESEDRVRKEPKYSATVRSQIARLLGLCGAEAEVAALQAAMKDFEVREDARAALARIPGEAATKALAEAATAAVGPEFRIGAAGSLAKRPDAAASDALRKCLDDPSLVVRLAAVGAIAQRPESSLDAALVEAGKKPADLPWDARSRREVTKARIAQAGALLASGDKSAAKRVFEAVLASNPEPAQAKACKRGLEAIG